MTEKQSHGNQTKIFLNNQSVQSDFLFFLKVFRTGYTGVKLGMRETI